MSGQEQYPSAQEPPEDPARDFTTVDLGAENARLRATLRLVAAALKRYHDAGHYEIEPDCDGTPLVEVVVPEGTRERAAGALAGADDVLKRPRPDRRR